MSKNMKSPGVVRHRRDRLTRTFAGVLALALVLATVVPPFALAEGDHEGVGTAPPGARPPGLQEVPGFEPGGEESQLEEVPIGPGEEEDEEVVPPAPEGETEPVPAGVAPPAVVPPVVEPESGVASEGAPPATTPEAAPTSEPAPPSYQPEESGPGYEPSPTPSAVPPVRNEAVVEPGGGGESGHSSRGKSTPPAVGSQPAGGNAPAVPGPTESPEPAASTPPAGLPPSLRGHRTYAVAPGDCLWTVAAALLPSGASNEQIAAEVGRLWRLNAARIGTGDPNLILVGTVLRLT
jgi:hypothetical protein